MFSDLLVQNLSAHHLLNHPFYKSWNEGALDLDVLQHYAKQYSHNVNAFPRYVSGVHSNCSDLKSRQALLENLIDEERGSENHPELWLRFAESLGLNRQDVINAEAAPYTKKLVDGFLSLVHSSYAEGLGALFAYEQQVPAVAKSKIDGLKKFYNYSEDNAGLKFFKVHIGADEWHSKECGDLLNLLSAEDKIIANDAAIKAAKLLWQFLDGVYANMKDHGAHC